MGNGMKQTIKAVLMAIGIALLIVIAALVGLFLTVAIGYFFGYILTLLPFVSGWLTGALPITAGQIPNLTAWLSVAGMFVGSTVRVSRKEA